MTLRVFEDFKRAVIDSKLPYMQLDRRIVRRYIGLLNMVQDKINVEMSPDGRVSFTFSNLTEYEFMSLPPLKIGVLNKRMAFKELEIPIVNLIGKCKDTVGASGSPSTKCGLQLIGASAKSPFMVLGIPLLKSYELQMGMYP